MVSDFQEADLNELLNAEPEEEGEQEKAYQALLDEDRRLMSGFTKTRKVRLRWPEPVRKRHIR